MKKYKDTFSNKPRVSNVVSHQISLFINIPIVSRPYKMQFAQKSRLKELKETEGEGIICHSESLFVSPVIIVQKKVNNKDLPKLQKIK